MLVPNLNIDNKTFYQDENCTLYNGNSLEIMASMPSESVDMIFADPPYMLSNNGFSCQNGKRVSVNKGKWDESLGFENDTNFHEAWISECRRILKPNGTIWISGTYHSIYQCGYMLLKLGFHMLNDVAWFKPNASPNLSGRFFTASHETLLWARKDKKAKHYFDYKAMKFGTFDEDKLKKADMQMRSVWSIPTTPAKEKTEGKHPTQKPMALLTRIIKASTNTNAVILDPFNGSGSTGIATVMLGDGRKYIGIDLDEEFLNLTIKRLNKLNKTLNQGELTL